MGEIAGDGEFMRLGDTVLLNRFLSKKELLGTGFELMDQGSGPIGKLLAAILFVETEACLMRGSWETRG